MKRIITATFWTGLFINAYFFIALAKVYLKGAKLMGVSVSPVTILRGYWGCLTFNVPSQTLRALFGEVGIIFPYAFWITLASLILIIIFSKINKTKR